MLSNEMYNLHYVTFYIRLKECSTQYSTANMKERKQRNNYIHSKKIKEKKALPVILQHHETY